MAINKSTTVSVSVTIKDVIDAMREEEYYLSDDEKIALLKMMFGHIDSNDRTALMGKAVDFISANM
ncbi:MAG: hypothetical protein ACI30H_08980 [Paludibacteraceae bacterium]